MPNGVRETPCTRCLHREVCDRKYLFLDIFEKVPKTNIKTDVKHDDGTYVFKMLSTFDWIIVDIECKHYLNDIHTREMRN